MTTEMITLRVTPEQKAKLEMFAKQRGCSVSDVIREWVDSIQTESRVRLRFTGKPPLTEYHSADVDFQDGEVKEVPKNIAERLLRRFPKHFQRE